MTNIIRSFFYSNLYLGIIAVALCIETNLQNNLSLNFTPFYLLVFLGTCIYYSMIYVRSVSAKSFNERTAWYNRNLNAVKTSLNIAVIITIVLTSVIIIRNLHKLQTLSFFQCTLLAALPVAAAWYTFSPPVLRLKKIRQTGLIKPFIIGFTWCIWTTIYPVLIWQIQKGQPDQGPLFPALLFCLQNFLLFSINAIIFDLKDYRTDMHYHLKTFPVLLGIKNTAAFVLAPLMLLLVFIFFKYQFVQQYSPAQTFVQFMPLFLMIIIIMNYKKQKPLLYYLAAVDGLLFLKAICGITSIIFLKK